MATQGIVTLMKDRKVFAKIVAGDNGAKAVDVAQALAEASQKNDNLDHTSFMMAAVAHSLGCPSCLTVVFRHPDDEEGMVRVCSSATSGMKVRRDDSDSDYGRYARTFDIPTFNPRWSGGTADYCYIVNLDRHTVRKSRYKAEGVSVVDIQKMGNSDLIEMLDQIVRKGEVKGLMEDDTVLFQQVKIELMSRLALAGKV